ncbi:MAG: hypothetical protein J6T47_10120 [Lachnospiraceae bacterium]|nr:hypothetical protein [Lachnospiraceae bacterium]
MKKQRAKVGALLACGLSLSAMSGCSLLPKEVEERRSPVIATQEPFDYKPDIVQRESIYDQVLLYPKFTELGGASLTFGAKGVVGEIFIKVGDHVKEGELLAELEYVERTREELEKLETELDQNRKAAEDLMRQKDWDLRENDIRRKYRQISKTDHAEAIQSINERYDERIQDLTDRISIQEISQKQLQEAIEEGTIVSPIEGTVSTLRADTVGKYVENAETFVSIVDSSLCMFELETEYADHFTVGQEVAMEMSTSVYVETVVYSVEGNRVLFKPSSDQIIALNASSRFFLVLDKRENALTINKTSVRFTDDAAFVYVLDENGLRTMREVTAGMIGGPADTSAKTRIEIVDGLEQGDVVIGR